MVSRVFSAGIDGINGYIVTVECLLSGGLPRLDVVGLPTGAVSEAGERVRAAAKSCSFDWPVSRLTVNLAPADTRKAGTAFDLPILLSILAAAGEINALPQDALFFGELSLSGELRPVRGALSMALAARSADFRAVYVPAANAQEASYADSLTVYPVRTLSELINHLSGRKQLVPCPPPPEPKPAEHDLDYAHVLGQHLVKHALEVLRQPMEDGKLTIARAAGQVTYPADFQLIAAMNPCPCGWYGTNRCTCTKERVQQYLRRLSGPLLDRIDLQITVQPVEYEALAARSRAQEESSETIRARVLAARQRQYDRQGEDVCNDAIPPSLLAEFCPLTDEASAVFRRAFERLGLTARAHDRILRVARTVADLAGKQLLDEDCVLEALQYRAQEKVEV